MELRSHRARRQSGLEPSGAENGNRSEAGALDAASKAFTMGDSLGSRVGAAVAAKLSGRNPKREASAASKEIAAELERMNQRLENEAGSGRKKPNGDVLNYLAQLNVHRATLEHIAASSAAAKATLATARATCGKQRTVLDAFARIAGLRGWARCHRRHSRSASGTILLRTLL